VLHAQGGGRFIGFAKTRGGGVVEGHSGHAVTMLEDSMVMPFASLDQADDWFGDLDPGELVYAAYYDARDPTWPSPLNETFGRSQALARRASHAITSGGFDPAETKRKAALHLCTLVHDETGMQAVGFLEMEGNAFAPRAFHSFAEAQDWFERIQEGPRSYSYLVFWTWDPNGNPLLGGESFGSSMSIQPHTTSGAIGILPWLAVAAAGGAGWTGRAWWEGRKQRLAAEAAAAHSVLPPTATHLPHTVSGGLGLVPWLLATPPWLALTAAGAAGWGIHNWWNKYQARP
jgi:hypothetical protein